MFYLQLKAVKKLSHARSFSKCVHVPVVLNLFTDNWIKNKLLFFWLFLLMQRNEKFMKIE